MLFNWHIKGEEKKSVWYDIIRILHSIENPAYPLMHFDASMDPMVEVAWHEVVWFHLALSIMHGLNVWYVYKSTIKTCPISLKRGLPYDDDNIKRNVTVICQFNNWNKKPKGENVIGLVKKEQYSLCRNLKNECFGSKSKSDLTVFVVGIFIIRKVKINVHIGFISSSGTDKT